MRFEHAYLPLGVVWSSPFARWQGSLAEVSSIDLATQVTARALEERRIDLAAITGLALGMTIPQPEAFYAAPTLAYRIGLGHLSGPVIARACATSVAVLAHAAMTVEATHGDAVVLGVTADRTSNGPHLVYPAGRGRLHAEDWVLDNFARDPLTGRPMVETAETVAREARVSRAELDDVTALRAEQYRSALTDDRAFQRRFFVPVEVQVGRGRTQVLDADEGIHPTSREGLGALPASVPGGVVTAGSQTHPADGAAGMIVTGRDRAEDLGSGGVVQVLAVGTSRADLGAMPKAPVPAARRALADGGIAVSDLAAVTTHNPFVINDVWLARELGLGQELINARGSSLVYGHPQAPTGMRAIAELIETLRERGGGVGLFTGCAAGDTAAAVVLRVEPTS